MSKVPNPTVSIASVMQNKIMTIDNLKRMIAVWRIHGSKKIVFTNGCFDLLHPGHLHVIHEAKSLGDILIVGVNTDSSVRDIKPGRPVQDENSRAIIIASLEAVDAVILFGEETPLEIIKQLQPDIIVKGGDYKPEEVVGKDVMDSIGGRVEIIPLLENFSTTGIIKKMENRK